MDEHFRKWFYDTDNDGHYPGERIEWKPQHVEEAFMAGRHSVPVSYDEAMRIWAAERVVVLEQQAQQLRNLVGIWRNRITVPEQREIGHESPASGASVEQFADELSAVLDGKLKL